MMRLCALLAILFIIKVTSGQLEERCPSCCHHSFTETSIKTAGRPQPFWDCTADENSAINAARCMSECAYNLPPPKLLQCFERCITSLNPGYCSNCNESICESTCTEFSLLLSGTVNVNRPSPPKHPAFYTSSNGGYQINIEPRDSYVPDNTMNEGSGEPMNAQNLTYGFVIKLYTPTANKTSYCSLVDNNFGTFIRDIDHLCTPTQLSYAVVNRYGVSDFSPVNIECLGDYNVSDVRKFNVTRTCVSKDLRPGFEGHDVVEISWETPPTHEPHCVGEYLIDVSPSQSDRNDNECKSGEIISVVVDKHARCHQFLSSDPAIKLFNDSCEYDIIIHGRKVPELLGHEELVINETNEATLSLNQPQYSVVENDTSLIVTVTLSREVCKDVVVEVTISDGSAYAGQDYAMSTSLVFNVTISAGQISSSFSIDIINDMKMEDNETFHIMIRSLYLHHHSVSSSTVTIIDDDEITISFDRHYYEVNENDGPAKPVLHLSKPFECCSFSVQIELVDVTAVGSFDYVFPRNGYIRVIFPAGIASVSVPIRVIDDEIIERTERFGVNIVDVSLPHGVTVAGSPSASINILDDDNGCVHFDRDSYSIRESMNSLPVTLTLTTVASYDIYVLIATAAHTARDCDYNYGPYRATFKAGNQQTVFRINIFDDDIYEKSEGFNFMIANTSTYAVSSCPPSRGSVTIMDDEEKISLSFNLSNYNVNEDTETLSPVLTLDKPSPCCITVLAELTDVSATGGGIDYGDLSPNIYKYIFPAGETSATPVEPIPIINDNITESDETLKISTIKLSIPLGVQTRGDSATITIKDDDSIEP